MNEKVIKNIINSTEYKSGSLQDFINYVNKEKEKLEYEEIQKFKIKYEKELKELSDLLKETYINKVTKGNTSILLYMEGVTLVKDTTLNKSIYIEPNKESFSSPMLSREATNMFRDAKDKNDVGAVSCARNNIKLVNRALGLKDRKLKLTEHYFGFLTNSQSYIISDFMPTVYIA